MTDNNSKVDPFASLGDMSDFQPKSPRQLILRKHSRLIPLLMITALPTKFRGPNTETKQYLRKPGEQSEPTMNASMRLFLTDWNKFTEWCKRNRYTAKIAFRILASKIDELDTKSETRRTTKARHDAGRPPRRCARLAQRRQMAHKAGASSPALPRLARLSLVTRRAARGLLIAIPSARPSVVAETSQARVRLSVAAAAPANRGAGCRQRSARQPSGVPFVVRHGISASSAAAPVNSRQGRAVTRRRCPYNARAARSGGRSPPDRAWRGHRGPRPAAGEKRAPHRGGRSCRRRCSRAPVSVIGRRGGGFAVPYFHRVRPFGQNRGVHSRTATHAGMGKM